MQGGMKKSRFSTNISLYLGNNTR